MAKTSSATIAVTVTGDGETASYAPPGTPMSNTAAPDGGTVRTALVAGDNTITVPTGAIGVVVAPSTSSSNAKKFKGDAADVGVLMRPNAPTLLALPDATASFILNVVADEVLALHWL